MQNETMFEGISKLGTGRIVCAVILSLFFMRLPQVMPLAGRWLIVALIVLFFLLIPEQKGIKGGLIAGFFSLVFAGFGQIYVRQYTRGVLFITTAVFAYMTTDYSSKSWVFNNILFVFAAIDAFSLGKRGIGIV